jgi:hypothetical protein
MTNKATVMLGLLLFLIVATFPLWYDWFVGNPRYRPEPELPVNKKKCIEDKQMISIWHSDILVQWRNATVRDAKQMYLSNTYGNRIYMNLTESCMTCHSNKTRFCDRCHAYVATTPNCWDCHVDKQEK